MLPQLGPSFRIQVNCLEPSQEGGDARGLFLRYVEGPTAAVEHETGDTTVDRFGHRLTRTRAKIDLFGRLHALYGPGAEDSFSSCEKLSREPLRRGLVRKILHVDRSRTIS